MLSQRGDDPRPYKHLHGSSRWAWVELVHLWQPPTDLFETESAFIVRVEVAGMSQGDFSVTLEEHTLRVSGVRPDPDQRSAYHQMEIHYGEFRSDVALPGDVDAQGLEAAYNDGFLTVTLPCVRPRRIVVAS
jgi:HSP20 family molecular chaperone IbpA